MRPAQPSLTQGILGSKDTGFGVSGRLLLGGFLENAEMGGRPDGRARPFGLRRVRLRGGGIAKPGPRARTAACSVVLFMFSLIHDENRP